MQFADGAHLSYGPQLSAGIKIRVVADVAAPAADTKLDGKVNRKATAD
jgi:hypothetical protein